MLQLINPINYADIRRIDSNQSKCGSKRPFSKANMRQVLALLLLIFPLLSWAMDDITVPPGFVLQPLIETNGQIARPEGWFFTSSGTPSGWMWTLSKEDPAKGPY